MAMNNSYQPCMARVAGDCSFVRPTEGIPVFTGLHIATIYIHFTLMRVTCTYILNNCITTSINKVSDLTSETLRFTDQANTTTHASNNPLESTFMLADTTDRIEGFMSRPQRIATFEWSPGVGFHETINPWTLFMSNQKVRERLSNFAFLRCNMHIRIMINSTKFYYGRMMAAYTPMHQNDNITQFRPGFQQDFVEASQRPCVIMDPTSDQVGELVLPYMYPKSALLIPAQEWDRMGELTLADLTVLRNANNATDPITVTVFAWAENVSYSQPTSQVYTNEGAEEEYHDGPISKPAHKVARWLHHLADVPIIGPYMRATEMIASTGAAVARLFGYARPTVMTSEVLFSPYHGKRLAATNFEDTADPLSLDAKKEIPIDPRITGADGSDQMAFVPLAKRETYVASFDWSPNDAPDTFLYNIHVSPTQRFYEGTNTVHTTPAAWIASLFQYWRGTTSIRFEAVCSSFHRGRLRIVYDPLYQVTDEYNVNYSHVMDLSAETDYTMKVGWGQNLPYLEVDHLNSGNPSSDTLRFTSRLGNGVLSVYVVNSLTTPSETLDPITLNVYVSMNDDFEVQGPTSNGTAGIFIPETPDFPDPPEPQDPPEQQEDPTEPDPSEPPPNFAVSGPINWSFVANGNPLPGEGFAVVSVAEQALSTPDYEAFVLSGSVSDQTYIRGPTTMTLSGLATGTQPLEISFATTGPPGGIAPLLFGGQTLNWLETMPGQYITAFSETYTIAGTNRQFPIDFSAGPRTPLLVTNIIAERSIATDVLQADSARYTFGPDVTEGSDQYGAFLELSPGASIDVNIPGNAITDIAVQGVGGSQLVITSDAASRNANVTTSAFPSRAQPSGDTAGNAHNILNNSAASVRLYSVVWQAPIDFIEPDEPVFTNEGEVEEIQPERPVVEQTAAGLDENLPLVSEVFFGELPSSFRQVMKRYTLIRELTLPDGNPLVFDRYSNPRNSANGQVNPVDVSIWSWVMTPYLGWKGSTRHKIVAGTRDSATVTISRLSEGVQFQSISPLDPGAPTNISWEGSTMATLPGQVAEAVIPWYSNFRFRNCRIGNPDSSFQTAPAFRATIHPSNQGGVFRHIASGGEDYTLNHWVSTPVVTVR